MKRTSTQSPAGAKGRAAERISPAFYYVAACVSLWTFVVYLPALRNSFVNWDDGPYVYGNVHIRSLDAHFFKWAFFGYDILWHPLTWISHAVDYAVWGLDPFGHHLTSIVLHSVNAGLVVILTILLAKITATTKTAGDKQFTPDEGTVLLAGGVTGLLFGIHPIHVESTAWVAVRKDVLYSLFTLLSAIFYVRYAGTASRAGSISSLCHNRQYSVSLLMFALALCSKPMAVTLPVVLLQLDWYPLNRMSSRKDLITLLFEKAPYGALATAVSIVIFATQKAANHLVPFDQEPLNARILMQFGSLAHYLWNTIVPVTLLPFYPYPAPREISLAKPEYWGSVLLICGITAACLFSAKRHRLWLVCWGYFLVSVFPVLGLIQSGNQSMADRFVYLPILSLFMLIGLGAARAWHSAENLWQKRSLVAALIAMTLVLSYLTVKQIGIWRDSITLWTHEIQKSPGRAECYYLAYLNRGGSLLDKGLTRQAIEDFNLALANWPESADAHFNLALAYSKIGDTARAVKEYEWIVAKEYLVYSKRRVVSLSAGLTDEGIAYFSEALSRMPDRPDAYLLRGELYAQKGMMESALKDYEKACSMGIKSACDQMDSALRSK